MKTIGKTISICILEILVNIINPAVATERLRNSGKENPYSWLDDGIYDQKRLTKRRYERNKPPITTAELEDVERIYDDGIIKSVLQELITLKINQLETKVFPTFQEDLVNLEARIKQAGYSPYTLTAEIVGSVFSQMTTTILFGALKSISGPVFIGAAAAGFVGGGLTAADRIFRPSQLQLSLEDIKTTLESEKEKIIRNVVNEVGISDLEIAYVLKKRFYPTKIQRKIEQAFMDARANSIFATDIRAVLKNYLKLPIKKKKLPWNPDLYDFNPNSTENEEHDAENRELTFYADGTKHQLQRMALQLVASSNSDIPSAGRAFYFYGDPGTGKTNASRAVLDKLGLPTYEASIRSSQDLTSVALEGESFGSKSSSFGHFVQTLLKGRDENESDIFEEYIIRAEGSNKYKFKIRVQTQKVNETYKNSALILNDFDRVLFDQDGVPQPQALGMLLDYLDPTKEEFHSNYFDVDLSIQDLIIIITANRKVPSAKVTPPLTNPVIESTWNLQAVWGFIGNILSDLINIYTDKWLMHDIDLEAVPKMVEEEESISNIGQDAQEQVNDPLAALRERIIEVPFYKLDVEVKKRIYDKFLTLMISKYRLNNSLPSSESECIIANANLKSSLRAGKVVVEEAVKEKKILNIKSDREKFKKKQKSRLSLQRSTPIKTLERPSVNRVPLPLMKRVIPKVQSLEQIYTAVTHLTSDEDSTRLSGLDDLLGIDNQTWGWGYVECLWDTNTWMATYRDYTNLAALYARLDRFEVPDEQHDILRFHIQLVQYLTDILLKDFSEDGEGSFIYRQIMENGKKIDNIRKFTTHIELLAKYKDNFRLSDNREINRQLLKEYCIWLKDGEKIRLLSEKYLLVKTEERDGACW
ncbi:MAG: AAA family ATPase [Alphaproteobacteria bacterium]|jgi:hypothetical protein|nr:AAA family ATPase [Alphaproteobacteria bacterium]